MRRFALFLLAAGAVSLACLILVLRLSDRGSTTQRGTATNDLTVDQARGFQAFPLYWVGESYDGIRLDRIIDTRDQGDDFDAAHEPVLFLYGDCGANFELGCEPAVVIKVRQGCVRDVDTSRTIRGGVVEWGSPLSIEAGRDVVTIYASPKRALDIASQLVGLNAAVFSELNAVAPNAPFPGSLCELARLHPRTAATADSATVSPGDERAATVISSFGSFGVAETFREARKELGWRPARSLNPRYTLQDAFGVGALRVFKNTLPRLEQQRYWAIGHSFAIELTQEPDSYPDFSGCGGKVNTPAGPWSGYVCSFSDGAVLFSFFSGETTAGQRVRVSVVGIREYTREEVLTFAATLTLDDGGPSGTEASAAR